MADRLRARGDSWGEFVELLGNFRLDERERKEREKKPKGPPIRMPPNAVPKGERKKKHTTPEATPNARHDIQPAGYYRNRRGRPA